jgi:hypothetical protein
MLDARITVRDWDRAPSDAVLFFEEPLELLGGELVCRR